MKKKWIFVTAAGVLCLSGCCCKHLYVQQECVDQNFLASTKIGTPDPRQKKPYEGQRLLVAWDFPRSLYSKGLSLEITVRLWGEKEEKIGRRLERKRGCEAFFFPNEKIVTYLVHVVSDDGKIVETWKHHFWTEMIQVGSPRTDGENLY